MAPLHHCDTALRHIRDRLTAVARAERLPVWMWHETGDLMQALGVFAVFGTGFIAFIIAVVSHGPRSVVGWVGAGAFAVFGLFSLEVQGRRPTSSATRRVASAVRILLMSIGWVAFSIAALVLATLAAWLIAAMAPDWLQF